MDRCEEVWEQTRGVLERTLASTQQSANLMEFDNFDKCVPVSESPDPTFMLWHVWSKENNKKTRIFMHHFWIQILLSHRCIIYRFMGNFRLDILSIMWVWEQSFRKLLCFIKMHPWLVHKIKISTGPYSHFVKSSCIQTLLTWGLSG